MTATREEMIETMGSLFKLYSHATGINIVLLGMKNGGNPKDTRKYLTQGLELSEILQNPDELDADNTLKKGVEHFLTSEYNPAEIRSQSAEISNYISEVITAFDAGEHLPKDGYDTTREYFRKVHHAAFKLHTSLDKKLAGVE